MANGSVSFGFLVDPKGKNVAYTADQEVDDTFELFLSDIKTSSVTKLSLPLQPDGDVSQFMRNDPAGKHITYLADQDQTDVLELYQVDLKTRQVIKLNGPLVAGGEVQFFQVLGTPFIPID